MSTTKERAVVSSIDDLKLALVESSQRTDDEWKASLTKRKLEEIEFHDADREALSHAAGDRESTSSNRKFYAVTRGQERYVDRWLKENARDKVFLDYACGEGLAAIKVANEARLSIGLDISPSSLELARKNAQTAGVAERTVFVQGDCENTGLPDNSIDVVLCSGMLHHLDLSYAFPEIRRILKPGGKVLAVEALNYNPLIKAYRFLTPQLRTDWEKRHILSLKEVRFAKRFFDVGEVKYWHLAVLGATPFRKTRAFGPILSSLERLDGVLLKVPGLAQMAWSFTFVMTKRFES